MTSSVLIEESGVSLVAVSILMCHFLLLGAFEISFSSLGSSSLCRYAQVRFLVYSFCLGSQDVLRLWFDAFQVGKFSTIISSVLLHFSPHILRLLLHIVQNLCMCASSTLLYFPFFPPCFRLRYFLQPFIQFINHFFQLILISF